MSQPTRTKAIKNFLNANTWPDLADLYNHDIEVQVNVARDNGERAEGDFKGRQWSAWTDGIQIWKPIRIPYNAKTVPEYNDIPISYDLVEHAEGIGMTGWNWKKKKSIWIGFDFDAIIGHADKHSKKLTDSELTKLKEAVSSVPWITLRHSTSGHGLHLYVFINPDLDLSINNHLEHAALARSILHQIADEINFDVKTKVDTCGHILWQWHRKMKQSNGMGLKLIKQGNYLSQIFPNWKDHLNVITGKRNKSLPLEVIESRFVVDGNTDSNPKDESDLFSKVTGERIRIPLDVEHIKLKDWIKENYPGCSWWDNDHWALITHTIILKEAHKALNLIGPFDTVAEGREKGNDWNTFMHPLIGGAWIIRRFSVGCKEHPLWIQKEGEFTRCYINKKPTLATVAKIFNGIEDKSGSYWFESVTLGIEAAKLLGVIFEFPSHLHMKRVMLKQHKDGRLIIEVEKNKDDVLPIQGWLDAKGKYSRLYDIDLRDNSNDNNEQLITLDDEVRHLITSTGEDFGWVIKSDNLWHQESFQHVKAYLQSRLPNKDVVKVLGSSISRCWTLCNLPFQDEYPRDRQWNKNAIQLRFIPSNNKDNLSYPTWTKILNHLGESLNEAVKNHDWCKSNNIITGADYLKCWVASLFQNPLEPLPYLFFYGSQNNGKSTFHEMLSLLLTSGISRADNALINPSGFNGELEGLILAVIEETDLRRSTQAYNRIKDWVTSVKLPVHCKGRTPYTVVNTLHFIQCVPESTWVQTLDGPKQVKDLIDKDINIIVNSLPYFSKGFFFTGKKEIFEIETDKGYTFKATDNHKVLCNFHGLKLWKEIKELNIGVELCLNNHNDLSWDGIGNFEEGYIIGTFLGDGSFCERKNSKCINAVLYFYENTNCINYCSSILNECTVRKDKNNAYIISGKQLGRLLDNFRIINKNIHEFLENCNSDFCSGFLSGLFDTNGSCSSTRQVVALYQSNFEFLKTVQRMLLRFGIVSCISKSRDVGKSVNPTDQVINCKTSYQLVIRNLQNLQRFQNKVNFLMYRKEEELTRVVNSWTGKAIDVDFSSKVTKITKTGIESTYDITVPNIHAFDANGFILHNCNNNHNACPVLPGDSRVVMIYVSDILPEQIIAKRDLKILLESEASDFLSEILNLEVPINNDRLGIPIIITEDKISSEILNQSFLEMFLTEVCYYVPGRCMTFQSFYDKFIEWLDPNHIKEWSKIKVGRDLPPNKFPKGRDPSKQTGQFYIGNISFEPPDSNVSSSFKYILKDNTLVQTSIISSSAG